MAPGTGFREDNFSTNGRGGGDGSGGTVSDGEWSRAQGLGTPVLEGASEEKVATFPSLRDSELGACRLLNRPWTKSPIMKRL